MSESRTELLAWMNDLLQLNMTKIEQLGTGSAYCQIMDSIYGDVTLVKVKFQAKMEYEYVNNFKVLQACFDKHKVDKAIPVTKLVKCKMQDNLEFIQWMKRYWDSYYPGGEYDAVGRRGSSGPAGVGRASGAGRRTTSSSSRAASASRGPHGATAASRNGRLSAASGRASPAAGASSHNAALVEDLTRQLTEMRVTVDGLEKERDFYFQKLREIEDLVQQQAAEVDPESLTAELLGALQQILYSTEEGFDVPANVEVAEGEEGHYEEEVY